MADVKTFIPHFIQEQFLQGSPQGRFEAYTMYIDLSGFTALTEALMSQGTPGAEALSLILNNIFGSMVRQVYRYNGFIPYFAGDAITAIFPRDHSGLDAYSLLQAAQTLHDRFTRAGLKKTRFGDFHIGIKIRLSYGEVHWGIVGRKLRTFYFRGPAIDNPSQANEVAYEQGILFDQALYQQFTPGKVPQVQIVKEKFYRLLGAVNADLEAVEQQPLPALQIKVLAQFLPPSILSFNQQGEFRQVLSLFITFKGIQSHEMLDHFASTVLDLVDKFSGYFKEIDFGDKGGMMVIFFGAPVSYENNTERALAFINAVNEEVQPLQSESDLEFKVGISSGLAYTGIIGGKERSQYAAVGNRVNLAARLMTRAHWGGVYVDEVVARARHFRFTLIGNTQYKGIQGSVPTYVLEGRTVEDQPAFTGAIVGRALEQKQLFEFAQPIFEKRFAGIACLYGEAGIGKSRLAYELKKSLSKEGAIYWCNCPADQILRKPFNPFTGFLKEYFQQAPDNSSKVNKRLFEQRYHQLLTRLEELEQPDATETYKELKRTLTILATLIGISYPNSLWSQLDAKGRYQNTLATLSALFIAESLLQPVVIELEDGHWFDDSSREFLKKFANRIRQYPILLLITSRYLDDGSKPQLIDEELLQRNHIPRLELDLNILDTTSLRKFAEFRMGGPISMELLQLLQRTTNGNPFYLEQVLEYFTESQLLKLEEGKWTIVDANIKVSGSINAVLMARIDRLNTLVKETVKAAAVIGREFDVPILTEIMKNHREFAKYNGNTGPVLREQIQTAEKVQIWLAMNELRYIFRHSLLREAVYSMQMGTRLRELHGLIAEAIERLYASNLKEKFVDLAFHYELAEREDKAREYLEKAANHARNNFQNAAALDFYQRLIPLIEDATERSRILLQEAKVLELIGQWEACETSLQQAFQLAQQEADDLLLGRTHNHLGRLDMLRGNYQKAREHFETAQSIVERIEDWLGTSEVYSNLGHLYFRQGSYGQADEFFNKSLHLSRQHQLATSHAGAVSHLGLAYMNQGEFENGIQSLLDELKHCQRRNDKPGMATLYTNLGIVYFEKGDYAEALKCYEKGLAFSEELGNKQLTAIAIGCMGNVYQQQGDYARALENYLTDLKICEEMGDKQGISIALGLLGELRAVEGEFELAKEYLQKAYQLSETLNYQKGMAKAINNLGDIATFEQDYPQALVYYDQAIEISRRIRNQLVLGFSLVEKSEVLVKMKNFEAAQMLQKETNQIAEHLGNPDLMFQAQLLRAKLLNYHQDQEPALQLLRTLLLEKLDKSQQADVHFEMFQIYPLVDEYCHIALRLYRELYEDTPKYSFHERIQILESHGGNVN